MGGGGKSRLCRSVKSAFHSCATPCQNFFFCLCVLYHICKNRVLAFQNRVCQIFALNSAYRSLNSLCQSLHSNLSLYILLFTFFTFLRLKFLLIASECQKIQCIVIASERSEVWQSIEKFKSVLYRLPRSCFTLARNDAHFHQKFNSFHTSYPSFRSVQTDKKFYFTRRTLCLNRNL